MVKKPMSHRTGVLLNVVAVALWGTVFVFSQIGLQFANPYNLVFIRFAIASLAIFILVVPLKNSSEMISALRRKAIWLLGFIYMLGFLFLYVGQDLGTASEATLLTNLAPVLVPPVAASLLKDRISKQQIIAMILGLMSLLLVATPTLDLGTYRIIGYILMFSTSICYTLFTVMSKKYRAVHLADSFAIILVITVFLAPVAFLLGGLSLSALSIAPVGWFSIIWLGVPCTVVAITMYLEGLGALAASEAGFIQLLQVVIGLFLAGLVLGDFLTPYQILGAVLILGALVLGSIKNKPG
jgi:drug/metabolite transporter (DMT)-like permease